jgi:hypothetical protein
LLKVIASVRISAPALLEKTEDPCFKWKIQNFSILVGRGDISTNSAPFYCSGYKWYALHTKRASLLSHLIIWMDKVVVYYPSIVYVLGSELVKRNDLLIKQKYQPQSSNRQKLKLDRIHEVE